MRVFSSWLKVYYQRKIMHQLHFVILQLSAKLHKYLFPLFYMTYDVQICFVNVNLQYVLISFVFFFSVEKNICLLPTFRFYNTNRPQVNSTKKNSN